MLDNELKKIWKDAPQKEQVLFQKSKLLIDLDYQATRLERSIKNRDLREIIAACIVAPICIGYAFYFPNLLSKVGSILMGMWALFVIYKLKQVKKHRKPEDLSLSIKERLKQWKSYVEKEMKLVDSVLYWYILPPSVGAVLFLFGLDIEQERVIRVLCYMGLLNLGVLFLNKYTVKKTFQPVLKSIDNTIDELSND